MRKFFTGLFVLNSLSSVLHAQNSVPDNNLPIAYEIPAGYSEGKNYLPGTIVFKLKAGAENALQSPALSEYLQEIGAQPVPMFPQARKPERATDAYGRTLADLTRIYEAPYTAPIPVKQVMARLKRTGVMEYVQPHLIADKFADDKILLTPNDPGLAQQWHINTINAPTAWDVTTGNPSVIIAIVDGGTNTTHADLGNIAYNLADPIDGIDNDADGWIDNYQGWNTGSNNNNVQYNVGGGANHGVAVTGLASATTNNGINGAGVGFNCPYLPVKIANGSGSYTNGEQGIFYAVEKGAKIVNCSWGGTNPWPLLEDVTKYAVYNKGAYVVSSAGNLNNGTMYWPGAYDWVTCVAGSNSADLKSSTSCYYDQVDITAPGENMFTTSLNTFDNVFVGTSWAAPVVSGAAALVKSQFPAYGPDQIEALLKETSFNLYTLPGNAAYADKLGRGRLDVGAALTTSPGPSVEMVTRNWTDGNDNIFSPGENVSLSGNFVNWLNPSSAALNCTLTTSNPNVTIVDSIVTIGVLGNLAIYNNAGTPFTVHINPACPVNTNIAFKLKFKDGSYVDKQFFSLTVNPNFLNVTENHVHTSVSSNGRIGFMDEDSQYGLGLSRDGMLQHLVASSFMLANSATRVSDATISPVVVPYTADFTSVGPAVAVTPEVSDFDAHGIFNDNAAGANKLGITAHYKVWAWDDAGYDNFVILEYTLKNTSGAPLANLYSGIYSLWQMPNQQFYSALYMANWDAAHKLGYSYNAQNPVGTYAGVKLLSYDPATWYAFNNNGASGSINLFDGFTEAEKFTAISNGVSRPATVPAQSVSGLLGTGPLAIPAGDSVKVAFALVLGQNLAALQAAADSAQVKYDLTHATWTGTVSTDWNTPGNWTPNRVPNSCATDVDIPLVGNQPSITGADFTVGNIHIANGVNIGIQNGFRLNVCKNLRADTSTGATVNGGRLVLMGNAPQSVWGKLTSTFVQLNNASGAEVFGNARLSIDTGLELRNGTLTANGNVVMLSDASGTAYIDDFSPGFTGAISGNVHVQRYNPLGLAGFRQLGTPVQLPDIASLGNFTPSGTPGFVIPVPACDPNFVDASSPYGNWMRFVENGTVQYSCSQSLFEVLTSGGMTNARGYYLDVPGNSTLDFTGAPNTGAISFGLTHANSSVTNGWNQVSNPYPSPLQWEPANVPAGIDAIGKIWQTSGAYMGTFQDLDPNMAGIQSVAIGQAFQVRVSTPGATPAFAVDNTDRTVTPPTYLFAGGDPMTLNIDIQGNGFADLTKVRFMAGATTGLDSQYDSPKMLGNANQPMVYTVWNAKPYSTNTFAAIGQVQTLPLGVKIGQAGNHTFLFSNMDQFPATALVYLEDTLTHVTVDLRQTDTYNFTHGAGTDESRFLLHFYPPVEQTATAVTCDTKGTITLTEQTPAVWNYTLTNTQNTVVAQGQLNGTATINPLDAGQYTLKLTETTSGYEVTDTVTVAGVTQVSAQATASAVQAVIGQEIQFSANATQADNFVWNFGDLNTSTEQNPLHTYNAAGNYTVVLTASNGNCTAVSQMGIAVGDPAGISDEFADNGVRMWNTGGDIYLKFNTVWAGKTLFTLYDAAGKRVLQKQFTNAEGTLSIDANTLAAGMYTAELQNKNLRLGRKMMKGM